MKIDRTLLIVKARDVFDLEWRVISGLLGRSITTVRDIYFRNKNSKMNRGQIPSSKNAELTLS